MPFKKNQIVTLQIESLSNDGSGVAHQDGQAVFVPLTAPGDVTEVRIVKPMKTYAFGRVEKLITAGPNRIQQDCPVAGPCGGCGLRHISYQAECAAKTQFVRDAFARLGKLDVPVLALSQLSRSVESRQVKRPMLSDLRESGSLEQDADIVAFLYREDYYNPETENKHTELIIAKHRNGPVDTVNLFFQKQFTKFVGFTKRES